MLGQKIKKLINLLEKPDINKIIFLLAQESMEVEKVAMSIKKSHSQTSTYLKYLRQVGIVAEERHGKYKIYSMCQNRYQSIKQTIDRTEKKLKIA
jgi:DNA-binding transcriptional ArsR family regulator